MVSLPCSDPHTWETLRREGGREGKRGRSGGERRERESARNATCPSGHISALCRAFTFVFT